MDSSSTDVQKSLDAVEPMSTFPTMALPCVRCPVRATSVLTYDHAGAEAYLDDAHGNEAMYDGMMLCEAHAHRFTPPRGWQLHDRRTRDVRLFNDLGGS